MTDGAHSKICFLGLSHVTHSPLPLLDKWLKAYNRFKQPHGILIITYLKLLCNPCDISAQVVGRCVNLLVPSPGAFPFKLPAGLQRLIIHVLKDARFCIALVDMNKL